MFSSLISLHRPTHSIKHGQSLWCYSFFGRGAQIKLMSTSIQMKWIYFHSIKFICTYNLSKLCLNSSEKTKTNYSLIIITKPSVLAYVKYIFHIRYMSVWMKFSLNISKFVIVLIMCNKHIWCEIITQYAKHTSRKSVVFHILTRCHSSSMPLKSATRGSQSNCCYCAMTHS
jgi:hypothetical protein